MNLNNLKRSIVAPIKKEFIEFAIHNSLWVDSEACALVQILALPFTR